MENQVKVLIVRFSSIGDIVLTTPIIRCLKNQLEGDVHVHYLTKAVYEPILSANPYLNKVHTINKHVSEILPELKEENFDFIIDLHKNLRSRQVIRGLKRLAFTFDKLNIEKWLLVNFGINRMPKIHLVDRYFQAVQALGVENDGMGLDYFVSEKEQIDVKRLDDKFSSKFIAIAIGGKFSGKKLPDEKLIEMCKSLNYPFIIMGGREDSISAEKIAKTCPSNSYNACGAFSINQSASIISQAELVITHDTGLMHIAAAFKRNIISIWGATVPEFGMYPYLPGEKSIIIQAEHLSYRPTSKLGNRNSRKELRTMEEIDLNQILQATKKIMD